jgi:hypothetical protein
VLSLRRRFAVAAGLIVVAACAVPVAAQAALVTFGSSLGAPASVSLAHPVDTAFWSTAVSGGGAVRAPRAGQIVTVRVRGCARRGSGGQQPVAEVHFQVLGPSGSAVKVKLTSGPFQLPVCGGAVSGATVSSFHPVGLCAARGDYVAFNDVGGYSPAGFPGGTPFEVFAPQAGAATSSNTGAGATNNGNVLHGSAHRGLELLMQLVLGTGANGRGCPG